MPGAAPCKERLSPGLHHVRGRPGDHALPDLSRRAVHPVRLLLLSSITFDVYIDAVEDSQVLQVSSSVISLLMHDNIYVEAFANRAAAERFSDVMWAMQQILFMSFDRKARHLPPG